MTDPNLEPFDPRAFVQEETRIDRQAVKVLLKVIASGDGENLWDATALVDQRSQWPAAFRAIGRLPSAPQAVREAFVHIWVRYGDHLRQEGGTPAELTRALRVLMPAYTGGPLTLYRGESAWNRRRATYGACWTTHPETARAFALGAMRCTKGGSVLLRAQAPAEAIISAVHQHDGGDRYAEDEVVVDRRCLGPVRVLERFGQMTHQEHMADVAGRTRAVPISLKARRA